MNRSPAKSLSKRASAIQRGAFTLVELLVVITILAILASMMLFGLTAAYESAKEMRTRGTIAKLNTIVMQKYESYRTRRIPLDTLAYAKAQGLVASTATTVPQAVASQVRVDTIRELMRLEMPERLTDITDNPDTNTDLAHNPLPTTPSQCATYINVIYNLLPVQHQSNDTIKQKVNKINSYYGGGTPAFETAKMLYLFVRYGSGDPDVMEQFAANEIATDTDNLSFFVDGWSVLGSLRPIRFLRWAPGFAPSPLQTWDLAAGQYPTSHDPFDPLRVYKPANSSDPFFNPAPSATQANPPLYPLIYSTGGAEQSTIYSENVDNSGNPIPLHYSGNSRANSRSKQNDPYAKDQNGLLGSFDPAGSRDITNQDIETR